ncbi:SCO2322 family protein [Streptomyces sp. NBC_01387]|uniref:SCO2322 family protein n=1 Tax=unclassified Streptomyces TaxID=2593676 RepID=UPI0022531AB7|nr:SCO2322 family protein [Streptomyces sp. NBC_01500]MCX4551388.1 SCO2322 family protein [Streptomyces sp. NBC_01500]
MRRPIHRSAARHRTAAPAAVLTVVAALALALLGAVPAQAAGYRYWSFWDRTGSSWTYATQGPSTARPSDGDVQGFRFAVSEDSQDASKPRGPARFDTICGKTPAEDGAKRVALVIDFGTAADAPGGEKPPVVRTACARVGTDATSAEALAAVAKPLRYNSEALLCSIAGYPRTGCGEQISTAHQDPQKKPSADGGGSDSGGPSAGLVGGLAAVVVLGAAGVWQARRRRNSG